MSARISIFRHGREFKYPGGVAAAGIAAEGTTRKETSQEEFRARVGPFKKSLLAQRFHGDSLPPPPRAEVTTDQTDGVRDARDTGSHAEEREDDVPVMPD